MKPERDADAGRGMHELMAELFPLCRSITGDGVRETLRRMQRLMPLEIREVPTGTAVLDWVVPPEWNCRGGWIEGPGGARVVDFEASNLHVMGYSVPVRRRVSLAELRSHVHTLPDRPDWIPYRTSYYRDDWAFCMAQRVLDGLDEGEYEVCIDSRLASGSLTYGELLLEGESDEEILISTHVCHPSLANDNLSGIAVALFLARSLSKASRRHTFRFLFVPGTIGSITWLALHEDVVPRIRHGLVLAGLGDPGVLTYKRSRRGDAPVDRAAALVWSERGGADRVVAFSPYGYDERQYGSPGYNLPVGMLMRTPFGEYPEYHTSADNLAFVRPEKLADSLDAALAIVAVLERNWTPVNMYPRGEPQLGRRGLYDSVGAAGGGGALRMGLLWVLNQADGGPDLMAIAARSGLTFDTIAKAAELLRASGLVRREA